MSNLTKNYGDNFPFIICHIRIQKDTFIRQKIKIRKIAHSFSYGSR
jgi:hypothetical protein